VLLVGGCYRHGMPPNVTLRGSAGVPSDILINVDHVTVFGDGSLKDPLRAPGAAGTPTTEHVAVTVPNEGATLNPDVDVAYVELTPNVAIHTTIEAALPDGSIDGQQITVVFTGKTNVEWNLVPDSFTDTDVAFPTGESGAATLVWDDTSGIWRLVSTDNGTIE
jgi:hypothetical protein